MATPTLYISPLLSNPLTVDNGAMALYDPTGAPISPPLSQESCVSLTESEPTLQSTLPPQQHLRLEHRHLSTQLPSTLSSKKTLNWVNALPSHFDTTSSEHPRKRRRRTNREELEILEDAFAKSFLPDAATRQELGERLGMSVRAVQIWFQNRRQTLRKKSVSVSSDGHPQGYEDDLKSDQEYSHSEDRPAALNFNTAGGGGGSIRSKRGSKSCSNLLSSTPPPIPDSSSQTLLRAETCSSLPTIVSALPPQPPKTPSADASVSPPKAEGTQEAMQGPDEIGDEVVVKTEVVDSETHLVSAAVDTLDSLDSIQGIDVKTAERHLCLLLEEARKRSGQHAAPVMGLWSEHSSKLVLNASPSENPSGTTTFPASKRTMSRSSSSLSNQHSRSSSKTTRKHRSVPDPILHAPPHASLPYPRTVSLMEQVINRQHLRPASGNFKQSALSSTGKHTLDSVSRRGLDASPTSTGLTPLQFARRLQYVMSSNFKRVQSESVLNERQNAKRLGQTATKARRLSIGNPLFDPDTGKEGPALPSTLPQRVASKERQVEQGSSHQAQKRRAGTSEPDCTGTTGGDETDEEDFVALNERVLKRLNLSKSVVSSQIGDSRPQEQRQQQQPLSPKKDLSRAATIPQMSLKSPLSTLPLVTSSPTREYGLELERSHSPLSNYPIMERNRTWNDGSTVDHQSMNTNTSDSGSSTNTKALNARSAEAKDLDMDELECASVLAGLGWGR
ncbi:MAG: hypothetical protein J3Q66DRAFT_345613 [Benniella sp.]|nr:MAG: hypothetical protein J3Q66DRAFT_345613 [Benniella sp.]